MKAATRALVRLRAGSARAYRSRARAVSAWVARGRREDLEGWAAALGSWARLGVLLGVGYAAYWAGRAWPWLMWLAAGCWLLTAWSAGGRPEADEEQAPAAADPEPAPDGLPLAEFAAHVRACAGDAAGAHVEALAEHLTKATGQPWTSATVRARCKALSVPVTNSVRQGQRGVSTGVYVKHLPDPSPAAPPVPTEAVVVAGQDMPTGAATATTTGPATGLTVKEEAGLTIICDPAERRAYTV